MSAQPVSFDVRDQAEFNKIVPPGARLQRLATGFGFTEGPAWTNADGGYLVFSDIPGNRIYRWSESTGVVVFREPSFNANGNTRDLQGRLLTCEHGSRRLRRMEKDGSMTVLAERYNGKLLNSPNDLVVKSDGTIWFTDPHYGIKVEQKEQPANYVFRLDPSTGQLRHVADDFDMPNGLCFSPDEKLLYVADSGKPHHIRVFDVRADGTLSGGRVFCVIDRGVPDGIRADVDGRIYSSAGDGVQIFAPDGSLIGRILFAPMPDPADPAKTIAQVPANLCFGGADNKTLFVTARNSVYRIGLNVAGAAPRP